MKRKGAKQKISYVSCCSCKNRFYSKFYMPNFKAFKLRFSIYTLNAALKFLSKYIYCFY